MVLKTSSTAPSTSPTSTSAATSSTISPTSTTSITSTTTVQTTVPTTTTTVPTTTTTDSVVQIDPFAKFVVSFVMKIISSFNGDIEDSTKPAHKNLVKAVVRFLQFITNFIFRITFEVLQIKLGSAIVDVKISIPLVDLKMASAASGGSFNLSAMLLDAWNNASMYNVTVDGKPVDYGGMITSLETALSKPYSPCDSNPCKTGNKCVDLQPGNPYAFNFACQPKCKDYSCGIYSECVLDEEGEPSCVYSEATLKIFIGIAIGLCLALVTLVIIICLVCKWRRADRARKGDRGSFSTSSSSPEFSTRNTAFIDDESGQQYGYYDSYMGYKQDSLSKGLKIPRPKTSPEKLGLHGLTPSSQDQGSIGSQSRGTNTDFFL